MKVSYDPKSKPRGHHSNSWMACLAGSSLFRFGLAALGCLVLFQTERDALFRILDEANMAIKEERFGSGFSNGDDGHLDRFDVLKRTSFAACVVLQNEHENQYLTEWIAYHYHVLPLRRLIVWRDPLSETSPDDILDKWKHRVNITLWDHTDQIYPSSHPYHKNKRKNKHAPYDFEAESEKMTHHDKMRQRNTRQDIFFGQCLRRLKREGRSWAMLSHTDEYTLINPRVRDPKDPLHDKSSVVPVDPKNASNMETFRLAVPAQDEPGSVLKWLHRTQPYSHANPRYILSQPCIPLTSKQFGTREAEPLENETATILGSNHSSLDFLTLRWHYWGHPRHESKAPVVRKSFVDLSRIPSSLLHWKVDSHRPVPHDDVCPKTHVHELDSLFVAHHYAGTTERLKYGDTAKDHAKALSGGLDREERMHVDTVHNAFEEGGTVGKWLEGFVDNVGMAEAQKLLEGVGHTQ